MGWRPAWPRNEEILKIFFQNFNRSYLSFWAEYLKNIETVWRDGLPHHFKTIRLFLGAAVDEKTAAQISPKLQKLGDFGFYQST